jgi:alkanesulfonate monooxygenase SsuD/methylene tetrahydromethanopterin reductase-like flavin-dependent oxidoreductase (luciferase family)
LFGTANVQTLLAFAELGDRSEAFGSVWVGDSLLAKPRLESIALLSGIATRTRRVALGTVCMASMTLRDPILLAIQWASLDVISNRRTIFGACLGGGGPAMGTGAREATVYGVPTKGRVKRMEEQITLLRRLWTENNVTFSGDFYRFENVTNIDELARTGDRLARGVRSPAASVGNLRRPWGDSSHRSGTHLTVGVVQNCTVGSGTQ